MKELKDITRLDYFCAAALTGLIANSYSDDVAMPLSQASSNELASMAVDTAKAIIKEIKSLDGEV